jgi:hypothetical protein
VQPQIGGGQQRRQSVGSSSPPPKRLSAQVLSPQPLRSSLDINVPKPEPALDAIGSEPAPDSIVPIRPALNSSPLQRQASALFASHPMQVQPVVTASRASHGAPLWTTDRATHHSLATGVAGPPAGPLGATPPLQHVLGGATARSRRATISTTPVVRVHTVGLGATRRSSLAGAAFALVAEQHRRSSDGGAVVSGTSSASYGPPRGGFAQAGAPIIAHHSMHRNAWGSSIG